MLGGKVAPVAALAQQQQPVIAQTVFLIAVRVACDEVLHFLRAGFTQAGLQLPICGPCFECVAACLRQKLRQPFPVPALEGLVHLE